MADTDNTVTSSTSSAGSAAFATLSLSTIDSIRQQALASAPPEFAPFINARFTSASATSGPATTPLQPAVPVPSTASTQPATSSASDATSSTFGASLAQPTISFIREQILASAPNDYASAIVAQFTSASTTSGQAAAPAQIATSTASVAPAASSDSDAASRAFGASLAEPAIDYIRQQITATVPSQYAELILTQFASAPVTSSETSLSAQPAIGAASQTSTVTDELRAYFTAQNNSLV